MTAPNLAAPLPVSSLASASEAVRRGGLRLTSARRLVLGALSRAARPLRAQEIADSGELDGVRDQLRERFGFEARFSHFPLFGLCEPCTKGAG